MSSTSVLSTTVSETGIAVIKVFWLKAPTLLFPDMTFSFDATGTESTNDVVFSAPTAILSAIE